MAAMPATLTLPPLCLRFGAGATLDLDDLHRHLQAQRTAGPVVLRRPADILLRADGSLQRGYRFTPAGLRSLCHRLGPGLSQWLAFLAGDRSLAGGLPKVEPDPELVIRILNECIRHCFETCLLGQRLVLDPARQAVEGLVGPKYAVLSNQDWLYQCQDLMDRAAGDRVQFLGASLAGRHFLLRYATVEPWFTCRLPDRSQVDYRRGWYFSNSETGKSAARAGLLVVDAAGAAAARLLVRQPHSSRLRADRGEALLAQLRAAHERANPAALAARLEQLHRDALVVPSDPRQLTKFAQQFNQQLARRLPRALARTVANLTLGTATTGAPLAAASSAAPFGIPQPRRLYQLYQVLVTRAQDCFPEDQERTETLAYEVLRGRFAPPAPRPPEGET
jgi:hypothetical protein